MTVTHSVLSEHMAPWIAILYTESSYTILKAALGGAGTVTIFQMMGQLVREDKCLLYSHSWKVHARILHCPGIGSVGCTGSKTNWGESLKRGHCLCSEA